VSGAGGGPAHGGARPADDPGAAALEDALGHRFRDRALLERALTHASYAHEAVDGEDAADIASNERLEFLGDAVIGLVVARLLFEAHPDWQEGDLTRALHACVDRRALARLARELALGERLRLGRTERRGEGAAKDSILADAMEAVIGALYLDGGLEPVEALARRVFAEALAAGAPRVGRDPKTALQERVMALRGVFPGYRLLADSGVEGDEERFRAEVRVEDEAWGSGAGRSKRRAERAAAEAALSRLRAEEQAAGEGDPGGG